MFTIKQVITELEKSKPENRVYFSPFKCVPTTVDSWRGIYAEPALGWEPAGYSSNNTKLVYPTAQSLIAELKQAMGKIYYGWKGGDYSYEEDSPLHIDNSGDCTNTEIEKITVSDYRVIIHLYNSEKE